MIWDHRYTSFVFGAVGGLGVNLLQLFVIAYASDEDRPTFDWLYWLQFFGLATLGGFVALANDLAREISALVAFNLGISVPALIKTFATELQSPKGRSRR